jgi:hypothetical protein
MMANGPLVGTIFQHVNGATLETPGIFELAGCAS